MQERHRLKKSAEFQRVRAVRQSWAHPLMVLYAAPSGLRFTRVGISIGKRVGKAVVRNRAKRLIREAVRRRLPEIPEGHDLVLIARAPVARADFRQVCQAVDSLLVRARLLPSPQGVSGGAKQAIGPRAAPGTSTVGTKTEGPGVGACLDDRGGREGRT